MKLLNARESSCSSADVVFRQSRIVGALIAVVVYGAAVGFLVLTAQTHGSWVTAIFVSCVLALIGLMPLAEALRVWRPTNWLVAFDGQRLRIRLQSFMNDPDLTAATAVELPVADIASARPVMSTIFASEDLKAAPGRQQHRTRYLELQLVPGVDLAPLVDALRSIRSWPKRNKGMFLNQPVIVVGNDRIRIDWSQITPSLARAVTILQPRIAVLPEEKRSFSFIALSSPEDLREAEHQLRIMMEQGNNFGAENVAFHNLHWPSDKTTRLENDVYGPPLRS